MVIARENLGAGWCPVMQKHKEAVIFNLQVATVILEHRRLYVVALRAWYGLTLNEYCLMCGVAAAGGAVSSKTLTEFLMLKRGTVLAILASLEEKDLIEKSVDPDDHRVMLVDLKPVAGEMIVQATARLHELFTQTFWLDLPETDLLDILVKDGRTAADALRGGPVPEMRNTAPGDFPLPVEFPLFWSALIDRWSAIVKERGGLSFGEYRVLALLEDFGGLNPSEVSERLFIKRSNVSVCKNRLIAHGLVREAEDDEDGRGVVLQCTKKGIRLAKDLRDALGQVTRVAHAAPADIGAVTLNAWYARMYRNIGAVRDSEKELLSS